VAWVAGLIGLPLAHYWLVAQVEPFYSSIYCFLWWAYIFALDFVVYKLRGNSLLHDRPKEFLFLSIWSVPIWLIFEMANLRLHNWYYVMAPRGWWGMFFLVFAFGTVLPGLFETTELMLGLLEKFSHSGKISGRLFTVTPLNILLQFTLGIVMLALMVAFPASCFCLAWGFAYFLTDPICYWVWRKEKNHVGRSLLGQLAAGDNTRLIALLAAGFICGGLWESWNLGARTKWIYSVPFFDELKLGEMPVLGFFGFPPFALECYAIINFLGLLRGGRNWELSASENAARPGMPKWAVALTGIVLPLAILCAGLAIIQKTIASYSDQLDWYFDSELGPQGVEALKSRHALQGNQFLKLKQRPAEIDPALFDRLKRLSAISELKGIGLSNALGLEDLGIKTAHDLAQQDATALFLKLKTSRPRLHLEEVKVWVRAAKKRQKIGQ
jgi:hypothetical protein